jgi:hypothetical protein
MLKPVESPGPLFSAPSAVLNLAQREFPTTIAKVMQAALTNILSPALQWGKSTYVPARIVQDILAEGTEGANRTKTEREKRGFLL